MKKTRIHLSQPFEEILATVLSLPKAPGERSESISYREDLKEVVRGLYEAANGRQVETILGPIPIAPAAAPFLRDEPFEVETQLDFLLEAASRVLAGPARVLETRETAEPIGNSNGQFAAIPLETEAQEEESPRTFPPARELDHRRSATLATSL
jgi:hypothetical protein